MKKLLGLLLVLSLYIFTGCVTNENLQTPVQAANEPVSEYQRFSEWFLEGAFDTLTTVMGYTKTHEEFLYYAHQVILPDLRRLHQLFSKFDEFPGINNIYTINQNAGVSPVEVDPVIIEMLKLALEAYEISSGTANIAIGPITNIWRDYIAAANAGSPTRPNMDALLAASEFVNMSDVVIDETNNTVFLRKEGMVLDVGGIAKGFAVEYLAQRALEAGLNDFNISIGGDVRLSGTPHSNENGLWGVGVENPRESGAIMDVLTLTDVAVLSSGDYQRFFELDGNRYHHIIDPGTLMPATEYMSLTVIFPHAGMGNVLTTAGFILEIDEAKALFASVGAEAIWVLHDGSIITTPGYERLRRQ